MSNHFDEGTSHWLIWTLRRVNFHSSSCLSVCECTGERCRRQPLWYGNVAANCTRTHSYMYQTVFLKMLKPIHIPELNCCFVLTLWICFATLDLLHTSSRGLCLKNTRKVLKAERKASFHKQTPNQTHIISSLHKHTHYLLTPSNLVGKKHIAVSHKHLPVNPFYWKLM